MHIPLTTPTPSRISSVVSHRLPEESHTSLQPFQPLQETFQPLPRALFLTSHASGRRVPVFLTKTDLTWPGSGCSKTSHKIHAELKCHVPQNAVPNCPTKLVDSHSLARKKCSAQACCAELTEGTYLQLQHANLPGKEAFLSHWHFFAHGLAGCRSDGGGRAEGWPQ